MANSPVSEHNLDVNLETVSAESSFRENVKNLVFVKQKDGENIFVESNSNGIRGHQKRRNGRCRESLLMIDAKARKKSKNIGHKMRHVVGFTKCNMKMESCVVCGSNTGCSCSDKRQGGRKPAQICKPLRSLCKPVSNKKRRKFNAEFINEICKQSNTDTALRISSSISSICRRYETNYPAKQCKSTAQTAGCNGVCCEWCSPTCCNQCCVDSSVTDLECQPLCCQPVCNPCQLPPAPPCWGYCGGDSCCPPSCPQPLACDSKITACFPGKQKTGKHCPWKSDNFVPLPMQDPKPPCLPLPPVIPKPSYNCPCSCNCDETDSDVDVSCQNSIDDESPLAEFFQKKMAELSKTLKEQCEKVDEKTKELEISMKEKINEETVLCDTEKKVLESCRAVKKVECELMNIRNKICNVSLQCSHEKEESFCPKIAIQYVRVLQSKLEKVRSGSMLKECLLEMCKEAKKRLGEYNQTLRGDIEQVQQIAKKIKKDIEEIKKAICAAGGGATN